MPEWLDSPNEVVTIITIVSAVFGGLFWLIDVRVGKILHEVTPNSGKSMRDAVDRIENKLDTHIQWHLERTND
jgi:hypothetical protein|tara:strand:- start:10 stop:228 length:219 start_codon:yes stop_codon:yes gene_type:complete